MRNPSLFTTYDELYSYLANELEANSFSINGDVDDFVYKLFEHFADKAPKHRSHIAVSKKNKQLAKNLQTVTNEEIDLFNRMLYTARVNAHHRGVSIISESHRDYSRFVSLVTLVKDFYVTYYEQGELNRAFNDYISYAIKLLGSKITIRSIVNKHDEICAKIQLYLEVANSPYNAKATELYGLYISKVRYKTGVKEASYEDIDTFANFVEAVKDIEKYKSNYEEWLLAQFDGWAWSSKTPAPKHLHGEVALGHFLAYKKRKKSA